MDFIIDTAGNTDISDDNITGNYFSFSYHIELIDIFQKARSLP